jgi:hypothetical protein
VRPPLADAQIISLLLLGTENVEDLEGTNVELQRRAIQEISGVLLGQVESRLSDLGIPLDYLRIVPGDASRQFAGTTIALGWQLDLLGFPAFLTFAPRLCRALSMQDVGASLEFRLNRQFRLATSFDPVGSCVEASATPGGNRRQFGVDLFWERRY